MDASTISTHAGTGVIGAGLMFLATSGKSIGEFFAGYMDEYKKDRQAYRDARSAKETGMARAQAELTMAWQTQTKNLNDIINRQLEVSEKNAASVASLADSVKGILITLGQMHDQLNYLQGMNGVK